jgi:Flp pilus assembly pilin Flp
MAGVIGRRFGKFHEDERGAEGLEKLLIIAAIVLPLLGLLIYFRNEANKWVTGLWEEVFTRANQNKNEFIK